MSNRAGSKILKTTAEVMTALGGVDAVCALTGSRYKNTWGWSCSQTFPSRYYVVMTHALKQQGLSAPDELWGMVTPAERRKAIQEALEAQKQLMAS